MMDAGDIPPVADDELLARFATQSSQFRKDLSVKQDLFMPHPHRELSVMRHRDATEAEIWDAGENLVRGFDPVRSLYGRADIQCHDCVIGDLRVVTRPIPHNPNHADIEGWPESKEDKKSLAQKLAASASRLIEPPR